MLTPSAWLDTVILIFKFLQREKILFEVTTV